MAMFGFTFTLPGIAGIILTIGVAVDANVLIYERLREELAAGKSIKAAISAAYDKAFSAIFDANITTLITALILFWRASGTVKGFAVTLTIGILASMLAALLCTRVLFWWFSDAGVLKKLTFMNLIPKRAFNFLGKRKLAFSLSIILIVAGLELQWDERKTHLSVLTSLVVPSSPTSWSMAKLWNNQLSNKSSTARAQQTSQLPGGNHHRW